MFRAISLGVFCRFAPSTRAIIRSMNVWPGCGGDLDDDPVGQHLGAAGDRAAVAAALADHRRRLAGDGRLVDAGDAVDDVAVAGDHVAGLADDHGRPSAARSPARLRLAAVGAEPTRHRCRGGCARSDVGLGRARGPPRRPRRGWRTATVSHSHTVIDQAKTLGSATASDRGQHGADQDDEHHRVVPHDPGIELAQRLGQRRQQGRAARSTPDADAALPADDVRSRGEGRS